MRWRGRAAICTAVSIAACTSVVLDVDRASAATKASTAKASTTKASTTKATTKKATARKTTTKKGATTTTRPSAARERIPPLPASEVAAFCKLATLTKGKLAELEAKKQQLGSNSPASLYQAQIEAEDVLAKASPKQLAPDFVVVRNYLSQFMKLASTKDADELGKISAEMGSDAMLTEYLDATIRIEGYMRRTCGFPVGV